MLKPLSTEFDSDKLGFRTRDWQREIKIAYFQKELSDYQNKARARNAITNKTIKIHLGEVNV